jgi:6-phosphogluconate dehydrogenase
MQLGMIGLGKMGGNMAARLRDKGHDVVGFDFNPDVRDVGSVAELVERLSAPRIVWLMVPAGEPTRSSIRELGALLEEGDLVIEGGNSHYQDDRKHAEELSQRGIEYLDAGVSGGVWGRENGYGIMVGGSPENVARARPIFDALTPDEGGGFVHAGAVGAGHFVKMVHNGIEYGMMQAFAEGFNLMRHKEALQLDLAQIAEIWRHGSVVRSWLLDLTAMALAENPTLAGIAAYVPDSGEGRWTAAEGIEQGVPLPVITLALTERFRSQETASFADKLLAAMRQKFGGHAVKTEP